MSCPDICPTDLLAIGQAIQSLGTEERPAATGKPHHAQTRNATRSATLGAYAAVSFHPRFSSRLLTGSEAQIGRVAADYKVFRRCAGVPHSQR